MSDTALVTLAQAKAHLRLAQDIALHSDAEYIGLGDGETVEFTLDHTPLEGTINVYVNGSKQTVTTDYSFSGTTLTFTEAGTPDVGEPITASYDYTATEDTFEDIDDSLIEALIEAATSEAERYTARAFVQRSITESHNGNGLKNLLLYRQPVVSVTSVAYRKLDTDTGDASTVAFTLGGTPKSGTLTVHVAGTLMTLTSEYTISGKVVTFASAPADDAAIVFRYQVSLAVGSDYTERLHIGRLYGSWDSDYEYIAVYTAGYETTRASVQSEHPVAIQAVLQTVAFMYEHPIDRVDEDTENRGMGISFNMPPTAQRLLNLYKVAWV